MDAQFSSWGGKKNSVRLIFEKKPEIAAVLDAQFSSWGDKKNSVKLIFEKKPEVAAVFTFRDTGQSGTIPGCMYIMFYRATPGCRLSLRFPVQ